MQLRMQLLTHLRMQLLTQLRMQLRTCSVHATRTCCDATRTCSVDATATCSVDATRTCSVDATAHCMQAEDCVDRGLPSVRSARGLQGRQELGRMLVCVTDFVLRLGALGQLLRETSKRG